MIQFLIIFLGLVVLGAIFTRRFMMGERGASFTRFGTKKGSFDLVKIHQDKDSFEITVEEMIPERSTVDSKNIAKADTLFKKAESSLARGDQKHGEQFLIQSLSLDPSNFEAYHRLGLLYLHQGQFAKAENMYQKLVMSVQNDPVYFSNLGIALYQQKKLEGAKNNYKKAIELDASRPGRVFSLAQVLKELNEIEEAFTHYKKAIEMDEGNLDYRLSLAQAYLDFGLYEDAQSLLNDILAIAPGNEIAKEMKELLDKNHKPQKPLHPDEESKPLPDESKE